MINKMNLKLTLLNIIPKTIFLFLSHKEILSRLTVSTSLNLKSYQKLVKKPKNKPKKSLNANSPKSGNKKLHRFFKKKTYTNSQLNTTATWPSFLFVFFQNISSKVLIKNFFLLKCLKKFNKFWKKSAYV